MDILKYSFALLALLTLLITNNSYAPWAYFYNSPVRQHYRVESCDGQSMRVYVDGLGYQTLHYNSYRGWVHAYSSQRSRFSAVNRRERTIIRNRGRRVVYGWDGIYY